MRTGQSSQALPLGHRVRRTALPPEAVDALFAQSGVIRRSTLRELLDVAVLLEHQPLPEGPSVAIIGNSDALAVLAVDAVESEGLRVDGGAVTLGSDATPRAFAAAVAAAVEDPSVHTVLTVHVPPIPFEHSGHAAVIAAAARRATKPVVAVLPTAAIERGALRQDGVVVPAFDSVEEAVRALGAVVRYVEWRTEPHLERAELDGIDVAAADEILGQLVAKLSDGPAGAERRLRAGAARLDEEPRDDLTLLLAEYGITVEPSVVVTSAAAAVHAARDLGYPVAVTAADPELGRRVDGVGVRLDLYNDRAVRGAWRALSDELDPDRPVERSVQRMVPRGVDCRIATVEDPSFGPVVTLTVGGAVPQLLGDRVYRIPPLGASDARAMVRSPRVAPILAGLPDSAREALEELLVRIGRLAEESPAVAWLALDPVLVSRAGPVVLGARARVRRPRTRTDSDARRLLD